jgi:hypothetical protein
MHTGAVIHDFFSMRSLKKGIALSLQRELDSGFGAYTSARKYFRARPGKSLINSASNPVILKCE